MYHGGDMGFFGLLELPFLFTAVFFAFRVAAKLEGGSFGAGMFFVAWGFLVMALVHLVVQVQRFTHVDLLAFVFGSTVGDIVWIVVLAITWSLSAYGFLRIYRAASGG